MNAETQTHSGRHAIVARQDFSDVTFLLEIEHPMMARAAKPGQFVIVMSHEHGERIPLTLADFDAAKGTVTLVIQAVGKTTQEMQRDCQVGSTLYALVGPMGVPSHIGHKRKVVCVGGGLGVAPVYPQARAWKERGAYVIGVIGFRNKDLMFWRDKFAAVCDELIVCTDDGSAGLHGRVTAGLEQAIAKHPDIEEVVAIGPPVMMKGCRVKIGEQVKFACVDGPDFDGHLVDFEDLTARLVRYKRAENEALQTWKDGCRIRTAAESAAVPPPMAVDQPSTDA